MPIGVLVLGCVVGALAGLNSLGFVVLWRSTRVVNLAQTGLGMVGGVLTGLLVASAGWSFLWAAPVGIAAGALVGLAAERFVMIRLQNVPRTVLLVATVGIAQVLAVVALVLPFAFTGRIPPAPVDPSLHVILGPVVLLWPHLVALALLPLATAAVWYFLHRTRLGIAACALGQDDERARALGVPAATTRSTVWALAGALSAVSGMLTIPIMGFGLGAEIPVRVLLLALTPAVLTGFRSVLGTSAAALAVGVAYQSTLWLAPSASLANLLLAGAIVVALAARRRGVARSEAAARASSWEAASSPRPLPRFVRRDPRYRIAATGLFVVALLLAVLPATAVTAGHAVLYATGAATALGAIAIAVAWMFAGEIALGHWGLAGLGAAAAVLAPGPLVVRMVVAVVGGAVLGAAMGLVARQRIGLTFAVLSLTTAIVAPVLVVELGGASFPPVPPPATVGAIGGALAVTAAAAIARLRASRPGVAMVAGRDDPLRAPWLGVAVFRSRLVALGLSGALAGLAGAMFLLAVTATSVAPGAFDANASFDLLAIAVVGGLGSPVGALLGAIALQAAEVVLPAPWNGFASGAGILVVVLFLPKGLSTVVEHVRDRCVSLLTRVPVGTMRPRAEGEPSIIEIPEVVGPDRAVTPRADRIAGSDTREAWSVRSVRAATAATVAMGALGAAAAFWSPHALAATLPLPDGLRPWSVVGSLAAAVTAALVTWRSRRAGDRVSAELAVLAPLAVLALGGYVALTRDVVTGALALPLVAVLAGWSIGLHARHACSVVVPDVVSAVAGFHVVFALVGVAGALHLTAVARGAGMVGAARWAVAYASFALFWTLRSHGHAEDDRRRGLARDLSDLVVAAALPDLNERGEPALDLRRVVVRFGRTRVLDRVDLAAYPGEIVALVGGNGAGKSTLLKVAAGFVIADEGRVAVLGEDVSGLKAEERCATGLAFVSGSRPVFPDLTVLENLRVGGFQSHRDRASFRQATAAVIELVPVLADRLHERVGLLSGGEQRLLAVAQTLYHRPAVLLADEVTLGLDVEARAAVLEVLRMLADDGVAVVAVDHDLPGLLPRSDRALLLHAGEAMAFDDPLRLLNERADLLPATFLTKA